MNFKVAFTVNSLPIWIEAVGLESLETIEAIIKTACEWKKTVESAPPKQVTSISTEPLEKPSCEEEKKETLT